MEPRYLWLLYFDTLEIYCIRLSDEELELSKRYDTFEEFISENLEDKYNFNLTYCEWMLSDKCDIEKIGFENGTEA